MSRKRTQHTKQYKLDAVVYRKEHPDLTQTECAKNLRIGVSTLDWWESQFRDNDGDIPVRGSGNYHVSIAPLDLYDLHTAHTLRTNG